MMRHLRIRPLPLLFCFLMIAGCANHVPPSKPASVPEVRPGIAAGYLPFDAACDSLALLPPPPAKGSAAAALDEDVSRKNLSLRGTPRWTLAASDADLSLPHAAETFSCALDIPISEQETPHLYMLLRRTFTDAIIATLKAKNHYRRTRPFAINKAPTCTPEKESELTRDGSYPSGHSAIGWTWALLLSELAPEQGDAILVRGRAFGESRLICNVHWHSDVAEGRIMGAAVVSRLHANRDFLEEMKAAKAEIASVRAKGRKPTRNCPDEAVALARQTAPPPELCFQKIIKEKKMIEAALIGHTDGLVFFGDKRTE
jgi:acid phosphatase (class A)